MSENLIARLTLNGRSFSVYTEPDDDSSPFDCIGNVTGWVHRDKRPGEMILNRDHGSYRFFDFQAAVAELRRDGCTGPDAHANAMAQFEFIRSWCNDEWSYVGVIVADDANGETDSVWGIESDADEYIREIAVELARGVIGPQMDLFDAPAEWSPA